MHRFLRAAVACAGALTFAAALGAAPAGAADDLVSLAHLAPQLGYTYTWIASESAVALTRPGLYVLVRTGNPLYDVNDAIESTVQAPLYRNNDIYVGAALVTRLRALAAQYAAPHDRAAAASAAPNARSGAVSGVLTIRAVPTRISDAVVVSGTGPANAPLTITMSADISRDIPRVTVSRTTTVADAAGHFSVQIPTAPLHLGRSIVLLSVTSLPGAGEAHTSFVLAAPNPDIKFPVDEVPRDYRPLF